MFRFPHRDTTQRTAPVATRQLVRRVLFFGAGLILLWLALQLAPQRAPTAATIPQTGADDGVAVRSAVPAPSLLSAGNIAALLLLVGGVGGAVWLHRRTQQRPGAAVPLRSLGHMSLAPNQQLRLVRCGDDVLLLGVTTGQITLLKAYDGEAFDAETALAEQPEAVQPLGSATADTAPGAFASVLRHHVGSTRAAAQPQMS